MGLCEACSSSLTPFAGASCPTCGGPLSTPGQGCLECVRRPPPQHATVIWGEYDGVLRTAILALKHHGRDELSAILGGLLAARLCLEDWSATIDRVVHVPSHRLRLLRRGRSAAHALAVVVADELSCPHRAALRRRGFARQVKRSRAQRLALDRRAFAVASPVAGLRLLLVDDVVTTGATLRRASEALLAAGAHEVIAAALARTPDPRRVT